MPFIDPIPGAPIAPRMPEGITPPDERAPSLGATIGAAFGQDNDVVNVYSRLRDEQYPPDPDHNPLDEIRGTDFEAHHLDRFMESRSLGETRQIMGRITEEEEERKVLAASGIAGFLAQATAGIFSPISLLPGTVAVRSTRMGYSVSRTALATGIAAGAQAGLQEGILQGAQETRTAGESAVAVSSATLLGAIIGAGAASLLSRAERSALERSLDRERAAIDAHASGEPTLAPGFVPVFHGTNAGDFARLDISKARKATEQAIFFTEAEADAAQYGSRTIPAWLPVEDNLVGPGLLVDQRMFDFFARRGDAVQAAIEYAKGQKKDYVRFDLDSGLRTYAVINPDVIRYEMPTVSRAQPAGGATSAGAAATDTRQLELFPSLPGTSQLSVTRRVLGAAATEARRIMADLAETPYRFRENEQGVAATQGPALDRLARMEINGTRVAVGDELLRLYGDYRFGQPDIAFPAMRDRIQRVIGSAEDGKVNYTDFKREVSLAMQNGDQHALPQVAAAAQFIRRRVFEPWVERAEKAIEGFERLTPKDREGYFAHVWNKQLIGARRPEFTNKLVELYRADQETKRGIQQRLEWLNAQLQSWNQQIAKLEARFGRAEDRAKTLDARAAERSRDDRPQTVGMNEPAAEGRVAELQERRARFQAEAKDLGDTIDLLEELQLGQSAIPDILRRTVQQLDRLEQRTRIVGAQHQEAGRGAKRSEKRLAALEAQLEKTEGRKDLIEDYIVVAQQVRDELRGKVEAELGTWEGKSAQEAKSAIKAREKYAADTARADDQPRLTSADDAIDRTVQRILKSDRDLSVDELRDKARQTVDRILGSPDGRLPYDMHTGGPRIGFHEGPPPRGSLAERQLDVSNAWARDWIENDVEEVVAMHLRTMVPDVLLAERFGDVEMSSAFHRINENYARLSDATKSERERTRLESERKAVIRDVAAVRDRIRHVYGWSQDLQNMARVANAAKAVNNLTSMGVAAISSLPDLAGVVFRHGLTNALRDGWSPFLRGMTGGTEEWAKFKSQMRAIGIGVETAINARQHTLDDVVDVYRPQSRFERTLQTASDKFFVANMLAPLTDATKLIASHVAVSEILRASKAVAEGKATKRQIGNLAESGIDQQMAGRIWQQFQTGGESRAGVHLPNTADWRDRAAADALNGAVAREADIAVVTPGQEKPLWMSKPVISLLGQFKAFTASATERILVANLQRRDAAAVSGLIFAMGLGMLSYKLNSFFGGQKTSDRPQDWIKEGISRAGILGWLEDGNALASKATRGGVDIYRTIGADKPLSRFASRSAADMLLGPTWGKIESLPKITGALSSGEWSASDTTAVRRLVPLQNLFWLRGALNQVEAATNGYFGIPERREQARPN